MSEARELVKELHRERAFGLARRVLERARTQKEIATNAQLRLHFAQQHALSTYKDPDLPADTKLEDALEILAGVEDLSATVDQETLGLAGAIYKGKWLIDGTERYLETAAAFYLRGLARGVVSDYGYTAINAAFVLDLLADLTHPTKQAGTDFGQASARRRQAHEIRLQIVASLPKLVNQPKKEWLATTWWFLVTLGEAYFGLSDFENAEHWLLRAAELQGVPDWEREATARQLAVLMRLLSRGAEQRGEQLDPRAEAVLRKFLGNAGAALSSVVRGRVGLALSGGGFRASLYHIGVLARLAELDLLRHVEYLSCVSGGSIIGAHYYLEVRRLLEDKEKKGKNDQNITAEDYIAIVRRIERDFLDGVQRNVRTRVAAEWWTNMKMIFSSDYSRTKRAGELYEQEIYARVADGEGSRPRFLNDLLITPADEGPHFSPKDHNWRRSAKVPILILNATTLNTGHNWQFTASWMGEPPAGIDSEVDANFRLRRVYYKDAPEAHRCVRLGHAVAASACVPGLFEPLPLANLYERMPAGANQTVRPVVRLVDGGVHDNQGVSALLEQSCTVLLVSDASGQMVEQDLPSAGLLGVPLRSNSILQARVRVSQYEDLASRRRGGLLKGLMFVHLKKDLQTTPVDWIDCQDRSMPGRQDPLTSYGVQRDVQRRLAAIRTDLDSFSDVEAYALMASGYLMTENALEQEILGFPVQSAPRAAWKFLEIVPLLKEPGAATPLLKQLRVADKLAFKIWFLMRRLQISAGVLVLLIGFSLVFTVRDWWNFPLIKIEVSAGSLVLGAISTGLSLAGLGVVTKLIQFRKTLPEILIGLGMALFGFLLARLHLHVFDQLFLRHGKLERLVPPSAQPPGSGRSGEAERPQSLLSGIKHAPPVEVHEHTRAM